MTGGVNVVSGGGEAVPEAIAGGPWPSRLQEATQDCSIVRSHAEGECVLRRRSRTAVPTLTRIPGGGLKCLMAGIQSVFQICCGVPLRVVLDSTSLAVKRVLAGRRLAGRGPLGSLPSRPGTGPEKALPAQAGWIFYLPDGRLAWLLHAGGIAYPLSMKVVPWLCALAAAGLMAGGFYWTLEHEYPVQPELVQQSPSEGPRAAGAAEWQIRAQRGDFWGGHLGVTSSFAGTLLFFAALLLQSRELSEQRKQLGLQREDSADSRRILQAQTEQLERQAAIAEEQATSSRKHTTIDAIVRLSEFRLSLEARAEVLYDRTRQSQDRMRSEYLTGIRTQWDASGREQRMLLASLANLSADEHSVLNEVAGVRRSFPWGT